MCVSLGDAQRRAEIYIGGTPQGSWGLGELGQDHALPQALLLGEHIRYDPASREPEAHPPDICLTHT